MTEKEVKAFYNSAEWKRKRTKILERDHHECQDCIERIREAEKKGIYLTGSDAHIRRGVEVHHIKELREHPELKLNEDNLIALCTQCHNVRHGRQSYIIPRKAARLTEEKW